MISSLKTNKSLRRNKETYSRFYKKFDFTKHGSIRMSKGENHLTIQENRRIEDQEIRRNRIFSYVMTAFYFLLIIITIGIIFL